MVIYRALLAHGYDNFKLEILEHCEPSKVVEREQFYLDLLKPEYNIQKVAGSPLGFKHSEETILKLKDLASNRSKETLIKLKTHIKSLNCSQEHKDHLIKLNTSLEHIAKTAKAVTVFNIETQESMEFRSMTQAANFLDVRPESVRRSILNNRLLLKKYLITLK
jgi:group I intron endonuclease